MGVDNRLTADQLAALSPGDAVTIERGADFNRRRYWTGTVVRVEGPRVVKVKGLAEERSSSATAGGMVFGLEASAAPS